MKAIKNFDDPCKICGGVTFYRKKGTCVSCTMVNVAYKKLCAKLKEAPKPEKPAKEKTEKPPSRSAQSYYEEKGWGQRVSNAKFAHTMLHVDFSLHEVRG